MEVLSYKCQNCNGELVFDPESQKFHCPYCLSYFTKEELDGTVPSGAGAQAKPAPPEAEEDAFQEHTVMYSCPSCGAEVITDDTTAATHCFYCHNPVVLSGRLSGALKPDFIIPFALEKKDAESKFFNWLGKKRFVKRDFSSQAQLERLTGVYFPFWLVNSTCGSDLSARAQNVRTWRSGDTEYTETTVYQIERRADIDFNDMTFAGIDRDDVKLANGVYPFEFAKKLPFAMAYLSGFQAEKRTLETEQCQQEFYRLAADSAKTMLRNTISGYSSVTVESSNTNVKKQKWKYILLPVWVMTYHLKEKPFFFVVNGQTGKVCGRLPVDWLKLALLSAGVSLGVFLLLTLGAVFLL